MLGICHEMTVGGKTSISEALDAILREWIRRLTENRVVLGKPKAIEAEFRAWLALLSQSDDANAYSDLQRLVAIHSRNLGLQNHPASAALRQVLCLEEAFVQILGHIDPQGRAQLKELLMIVGDGHFLGRSEHLNHSWIRKTRDFTPVVQINAETVLAFLFLPLSSEVLDACLGRMMKLAGMKGASRAILDVSANDELNARFFDTLKSLLESREMAETELIVTGIENSTDCETRLTAMNCPTSKLRFETDLSSILLELHF